MRKLNSANITQTITNTFIPTNANADPTAASAPRTAHAISARTIATAETEVPAQKRYESNSQFRM